MLRRIVLVIALVVLAPACYAGYLRVSGNIHAVEPGVLYRSGQLGGGGLDAFIRAYRIRSILNLRGARPGESWYRKEALVAAENGVLYLPLALSAKAVPDTATMVRMEEIMRAAPKPMLVHCEAGSDRSGLASAIFEYAVEGRPSSEASGQLSWIYGHFPWLGSRTDAMDRAFARFVSSWPSLGHRAALREERRP